VNGFEKSGIFPVDGSGVLHTLREKKRDILAMSTPALQSLPLTKPLDTFVISISITSTLRLVNASQLWTTFSPKQ
jgi:hypothetical protein